MRRKVELGLLIVALLSLPGIVSSAERAPSLVAPGSPKGAARIHGRCPTFLWGHHGSTAALELVVYELPKTDPIVPEVADTSAPVLRIELPGGAPGWVPSADRCLESGRRYAWTLRTLTDGVPSRWAQPYLFDVAPAPTEAEVEGALETLRLYLAEGEVSGDEVGQSRAAGLEVPLERSRSPQPGRSTASQGERSPDGIGTAAISGNQPDPTGQTYGVEGVSQSPDGAGLAAENTVGGADLLLVGDGVSEAAQLTEAALDRSSADDQTYDFLNSGAGSMTLQVEGADVVTSLTDQDTLGSLPCAGTQIAKWDSAAWQCANDENDDTLGDLACDPNQVAQWNGSVWICSDAGTDTLGGLSCGTEQVVHWNGAAWVCGQPALIEAGCTSSSPCTASCPAGSIVWTGGCSASPGSATIIESVPTSTGAGQPPTGWKCSAFNPLGSANVVVKLYCVNQ